MRVTHAYSNIHPDAGMLRSNTDGEYSCGWRSNREKGNEPADRLITTSG